MRIGPAPGDHPPVPAEQRARRHQEDRPALPREQPAQRREQGPVLGLEPRSRLPAAQDLQLMAQDQDLDCVGIPGPTAEHEQFHHAAQRQVYERPHHQPSRILTGRRGTLPRHARDRGEHRLATIGTPRAGRQDAPSGYPPSCRGRSPDRHPRPAADPPRPAPRFGRRCTGAVQRSGGQGHVPVDHVGIGAR